MELLILELEQKKHLSGYQTAWLRSPKKYALTGSSNVKEFPFFSLREARAQTTSHVLQPVQTEGVAFHSSQSRHSA